MGGNSSTVASVGSITCGPPHANNHEARDDRADSRSLEEVPSREAASSYSSLSTLATGSFPPKTITVHRGAADKKKKKNQPQPFAQLVYDQKKETIVTMMETSLNDASARRWTTPEEFPSLHQHYHGQSASPSATKSVGTISALTMPDGLSEDDDSKSGKSPILLGEELDLYLLHDHEAYQSEAKSCTHGLQKLLRSRMLRMKRRRKTSPQSSCAETESKSCTYKLIGN